MAQASANTFKKMLQYSDLGMAALVALIVGMLIIPLPTGLIDVLLSLNIALGVVILLTTFYAHGALDLSAFPTILLIVTLFRLALNVSTTRLILLSLGWSSAPSAISSLAATTLSARWYSSFS